MEKLDALYKMAVIRDDAKAIEEIADMALEAGPLNIGTNCHCTILCSLGISIALTRNLI